MRQFRIAVLDGDGIGPDVIAEGVRVLRAVESGMGETRFALEEHNAGANEYLRSGNPLPDATMQACRDADAILLGAMGLPAVRFPDGKEIAPQLDLRERLELYAGVRPVRLYHPLHSPLRDKAAGSIDFVLFRESTEGMFWSRQNTYAKDAPEVLDSLRISRVGSERLFRAAFAEARRRNKRLSLVDKANVLPSMAYFRMIFDEVAREFPDVETERVYVDATALYMAKNPERFDVLVTENLFGDILSDLAAGLVGGMGMAPSADIGDKHAVFQPAHGSAPDIAGKGIANPVATILSVAMMLEWLASGETREAARRIYSAVDRVCSNPENRTADLGGALGTVEMGSRIVDAL